MLILNRDCLLVESKPVKKLGVFFYEKEQKEDLNQIEGRVPFFVKDYEEVLLLLSEKADLLYKCDVVIREFEYIPI